MYRAWREIPFASPLYWARDGMLKGLIFDVDGTLAETEEVHRRAFNQAFDEARLDWYWSQEEYRSLLKVTGGRERIQHYIRIRGLDELSDSELRSLHQNKTRYYGALLPKAVILRPGVTRLIEECIAQSIKLAIATTTTEANVEALNLAVGGAIHLDKFEVVMGGTQIPIKKPDPAVYFETLKALDLSANEVIAIEDSTAGVTAAKSAGITCVGSHSIYTSDHDLSGADIVIENLDNRGNHEPVTLEFLTTLLD